MIKTTINERLYSLDALRGFDMFWIIGAEELFHNLAHVTGSPVMETFAEQLSHPKWNGFHFLDLIFPLFLFIAGVATPYSIGRELEKGKSRNQLLWKVIKRGLILVLLGIIYNLHGFQLKPLSEIRLSSVLGRIGLAYMLANIIYLYTKQKGQIIWFWTLLIGYWLLLRFNSAPGFPQGDLTMEGNFASYLDRLIIPGKLYLKIHDPEGLTSTIPAIATGILGILTGSLLKDTSKTQQYKVVSMLVVGTLFVTGAILWNTVFPINKNLWTSSFVLLTGGLSLLLLAVFYYVIDVLGYRKWAFFFTIIGMNSILIYMSGRFINWDYAVDGFFKWIFQLVGEPFDIVVICVFILILKWLFLYFMYKKKVFLRV